MRDEFLLKGPLILDCGMKWPDYDKIMKLDDIAFAGLYLENMEEYRKYGWWGKIPVCMECDGPIPQPKQVRRYGGMFVHDKCFSQYYGKNGIDEGIVREYWLRVADMRIT